MTNIVCFYCRKRCDQNCVDAFMIEPGVYTYVSPKGVVTKSEIGPHITRPVHMTDDWFRWGHLSFAFESYRMWSHKMRAANPAAFWALVIGTPLCAVLTIAGWVHEWLR